MDETSKLKLNVSHYSFNVGDTLDVATYRTQQWETAPPEYLSEPELIKLMEQNGIGTQGTIPSHISKIIMRKYVEPQGDMIRRFFPTRLGVALAEGFQEIDAQLIEPQVRQFIERA